MAKKSMRLITVLLPVIYLEGLDDLVKQNIYPSRSQAIRMAIRTELSNTLWNRKEVYR
ncbi:MAG: ribbon-helix-helix domain-containing protein [Candidatus Bathyarchaeia archaeon]